MKIFLLGFMGCGKTTVGRRLAELIGFDFVDTDLLIERQQGSSVSDIFAQAGETAFRTMERDILHSLEATDFAIIATGGGLPCYFDNMDWMLAHGKTVYLQTSPAVLAQRLAHAYVERPLLCGMDDNERTDYISYKLAEREPFYSRAELTVSTDDFRMEELLRGIGMMK